MSNPIIDPANQLTFLGAPTKSQNNNTGYFVCDLSNYQGQVALLFNIGLKTAGDSDGAISWRVTTSTTNNISNATNYTPTTGGSTVSTTNNSTVIGTVSVDPRNSNRYIFAVPTVTGTNTPAYPSSVTALGSKKVEP